MKKKKLPHFESEQQVADFWGSHSLTDYLHEFEKVDDVFVLSPALAHRIKERAKKRLISIRLAEWQVQQSKKIAQQRKMPYQKLIREWIEAGLRSAFLKTRKAA
jgi:predicted DNA binding CopG/RHH family protein